jgi:hypothetical protein
VLGGVGHFVVAGSRYADPDALAGVIPVVNGDGYDGQFFFRLAADPLALGLGPHHGISLDTAFRAGRIGYPALAWIVSGGGTTSLVPLALVVVNVVAIGVLGYVGARLALDSGRACAWGLAIAGYFGFAYSLSRNLSEIVAAAALCTALLLIRQQRPWWAAAAMAASVLTREQAVLAVVMVVLGTLVAERRESGWRHAVLAAARLSAPPLVVFVTWQETASRQVGRWPALVSGAANGRSPTFGVFTRLGDFASEAFGTGGGRFSLLLLAMLIVLVAGAAASGAVPTMWRSHPGELLMGAGAVVLAVRFYGLTTDPAYYRQAADVSIGAWLVMWSGRRWVMIAVASLVGPVTIVVAAYRMLHL